ncbi:PLP-dependent aminotransferase family protein [Niallia sp. JL1B1071]|uniref:MocR-like pyridoxine biosynthesis transcription factor PdxR n=1 Tax=Niallia tiangongensis TaxID=3237105 RepID=UPI0037DC94A7
MNIAIHLHKDTNEPVYIQLYHYFKTEILTGKIEAGAKLPSIRYLASVLHISKNTVIDAYQQLWMEGYVESKEKSGYSVVALPSYEYTAPQKKTVVTKSPEARSNACLDFHYGDIDGANFPINVWKKTIKAVMEDNQFNWMMYGNKQGELALREELVGYLYRSRGIQTTAENLVITAGSEHLIHLVLSLMGVKSLCIGMEEPGYDGVRNVFTERGIPIQSIPVLEEDGHDLSALLNSACNLTYVTPSHQFPIGKIMPIGKRIELLKWAERSDGYILEDDYDSEFRFQGAPIPSMKAIDQQDRVIYLGTFSKAFLPSLRISYMILPDVLLEKWKEQRRPDSQSSSPLLQQALARFIQNGDFERHIKRMRKVYERKYTLLVQCIKDYMGEAVQVIGEKAGLHLLIRVPAEQEDRLLEEAERIGIKIYTTKSYYTDKKDRFPLLLGFGGLEEKEIKEGIQRLARAWFT